MGDPVGLAVGDEVGDEVGDPVGDPVGEVVGEAVGDPVGEVVGDPVGEVVGDPVGEVVGAPVGDPVGEPVGEPVGLDVGDIVGLAVGELVGLPVGERVFSNVLYVIDSLSPQTRSLVVGDTTVASAVTVYMVSAHKSIVSSTTTVKQEPSSKSAPFGGLPGTGMASSNGGIPSSIVRLTAVILSKPAPSLQIVMEYSTSIKQKWLSGSLVPTASQTYPAKVKSSSVPGPKVCFNTKSLELPSSQTGSITTGSTKPVISQLMLSASSGTRTMASPASKPGKVTSPAKAPPSRYVQVMSTPLSEPP